MILQPNETQYMESLENGKKEAEELLKDPDKLEKTLREIEAKFKSIPKVGNTLSEVPLIVSMIRSYLKKEYTKVPLSIIISCISALAYFLLPFDLIPDWILGAGYLDDAAVLTLLLKFARTDLTAYGSWRRNNKPVYADIPEGDGTHLEDLLNSNK